MSRKDTPPGAGGHGVQPPAAGNRQAGARDIFSNLAGPFGKDRGMRVVGIDTGGTFTDAVAEGPDGLRTWKVPSTPDDPARAIADAIAAGGGFPPDARLHHGTTVATNAVLTRSGARVGFVVTEGFRDLLRIGRGHRDDLHDLMPRRAAPLVADEDVFPLPERMTADGRSVRSPTSAEWARVARAVRASGVEAVAICLLHATASDRHERAAADALSKCGLPVHASATVGADPREVERAETTVLDAYVGPRVAAYVRRIAGALPTGRLSILKSDGTRMGPDEAIARPVRTLLSGPAAGASAALSLARRLGLARALSFDVGGTSTDVCWIEGDALPVTTGATLAGFALGVPSLDVLSVGAGGGSIVTLDAGGALRVGPESAGASPGPAAYGHDGPFTLSDAHLLLGRLPRALLDGTFVLDADAARRAGQRLAKRAGCSLRVLCEGSIRVAEATTARALRRASAALGRDPRGATLIAFGGAGGLLAARTAALSGLDGVAIPWSPGTFAAQGARLAPRATDATRMALGLRDPMLGSTARALAYTARRALAGAGERVASVLVEVDARLIGRTAEVTVAFDPSWRARAHAAFHARFGFDDPSAGVEAVRLRARAIGHAEPFGAGPRPARRTRLGPPSSRLAGIAGAIPAWRRDELGAGTVVRGEALVLESGATTYVPRGGELRVLPDGTLMLRARS